MPHLPNDALVRDTIALAAKHGLTLTGPISFNEIGLDFRVGFATDKDGKRWILRVPRREDVQPKIDREARILDFVKRHLPVHVPDWQIRASDLIAYPMLTDQMALTFNPETYAVTWNIDQSSPRYTESLGKVLAALHAVPVDSAKHAGIPVLSPDEARGKMLHDLELVKKEVGISYELERRCRTWLENDHLWPTFSVLTHGDLYAGHVTAKPDGEITGVIDWTEAEVSDPGIDFSGHLAAFNPESLAQLIASYERAGGRTWPGLAEHAAERFAASPIKYGVFAIITGNHQHLAAAKTQLGL